MSPGLDFQEAFLLLYSDAIMLVLGVTLAIGILVAMARGLVLIEPRQERPPEIEDE